MFQEPVYRENLSLKLSEVLDDVGVNERSVMRMRRLTMMKETMDTITYRSIDRNLTFYYLGSRSEGTTTIGLQSDEDFLICDHDFNVIQDWSDWEQGKINLLMIQNEDTTPGYCFLQLLKPDEPLPETVIPNEYFMSDRCGRILHKNILHNISIPNAEQHGPSLAIQGQQGFCDQDIVKAYPCKSWPPSASDWLQRQGIGRWPTQEMRSYAASTSCFVVPTGSKVSVHPELEWRISTTLAERCLMFSLNITQIRCYVLLKMVLKSFLNPKGENNLSSFMCKTVLLRSIENTESCIWIENNVYTCLTYCLLELHSCIQNAQCSHFILSENNLMARQFTAQTKHQLSKNISDFIQSDGQKLLQICTDDVGHRLQVKMNIVPLRTYTFPTSIEIYQYSSAVNFSDFALEIAAYNLLVLKELNDKNIKTMKKVVAKLMTYSKTGNQLEHTSSRFLTPFLYTTLGTVLASSSIGQNNQVSLDALVWLSAGLTSDMASSKLKLASVIYSTGNMEKTELILRQIERQFYQSPVYAICSCYTHSHSVIPAEIERGTNEQNEEYFIKNVTAFCVQFSNKEINCVPKELQYEMFRSTQDDMLHRDPYNDGWMNLAVVDCLPYLYFLQYKTYGHLQRHQDQQQALTNLITTIVTEESIYHRETALNILGQCMEQENRPRDAINCYMLSLQQRARNNAANFHVCQLLSGALAGQ